MPKYALPPLTAEMQTELTRHLATAGRLLLQYGAESRQIEQTLKRFGAALGVESVELAMAFSSIVITTLHQGRCITTTRQVTQHGINMGVVADVIRICIMTEKGLLNIQGVGKRLNSIQAKFYPKPLLIFMVALSCASFSLIFGASLPVALVTLLASATAMTLRVFMHKKHFSPFIIVPAAAFVATLIAFLATWFEVGPHPELAMAASVLLLIPGFPLVNAVSDMVKGYVNMGIARWVTATLITISAVLGIVAAVSLTDSLVGAL